MGLNICVETLSGEEHPDWDWIRYAGDREFVGLIGKLPTESKDTSEYPDPEPHYRPTDFAAWRAAVTEAPFSDRHRALLDILERDTEYWIWVSV